MTRREKIDLIQSKPQLSVATLSADMGNQNLALQALQENGVPFTTSDEDWPPTEPRNNRLDIKLAILAIGKITPATMRMQINLAGLGLRELNLINAKLHDADFRWTNLEDADLSGAGMENALLTWANLKNAKLIFTNLPGAIAIGADISGAQRDGWESDLTFETVFAQDKPPLIVPSIYGEIAVDDEIPLIRAYEWKEVDGIRLRFFVSSGRSVDKEIEREIRDFFPEDEQFFNHGSSTAKT